MQNKKNSIFFEQFITDDRKRKINGVLSYRINRIVLVLENIYDPHNVSAVIRTCDGLGFLDLYIVDPNKKIKYSSPITTGAEKWLNIFTYNEIGKCYEDLRKKGYQIYASVLDKKAENLTDIDINKGKTAFVLGNEHSGLTEEAINGADGLFYIPMYGFVQSFNISVTAAMVLYWSREKLNMAGISGDLSDKEIEKYKIKWLSRDLGIKT